jgi:hypothetical protein
LFLQEKVNGSTSVGRDGKTIWVIGSLTETVGKNSRHVGRGANNKTPVSRGWNDMTERKAYNIGILIIATFTLMTPAVAGVTLPGAIDDMGGIYFTIMFAFVGACAGVLVAKIPKRYIKV